MFKQVNMKHIQRVQRLFLLSFICLIAASCGSSGSQGSGAEKLVLDPLPSWNEGPVKTALIDFVHKTTKNGSPDFIPVSDRIACFDNDGTLWSEHPMYFQMAFALDRIKAMAPNHPEWKTTQPFKGILEDDLASALAGGEHALLEIVMSTHAGMSTDEFNAIVKDWISTATHPKTGKKYIDMVFQPMVELLAYLRSNDYKTFIVSGGGVDFMRAWVESAYGIPTDQVVGSSDKVKYEVVNGVPTLIKLPELNFIDDKEGKPVGIHQYIGKRPVFTAGNSDGDYQMLQWTSTGDGARFGLIIHHTDAEREYAYDRETNFGKLDKALDDASTYKCVIVDMKNDWNKIYDEE